VAESKSNILYKGFDWSNHHDRSDKWLKIKIDDPSVEWVRTDRFTYQCSTDRDYEKHLSIVDKDYNEVKITKLVVDGERIYEG
jgi:hypothetical protein